MIRLQVYGSLQSIMGFHKGDDVVTHEISFEAWQGILTYLVVYVMISMMYYLSMRRWVRRIE